MTHPAPASSHERFDRDEKPAGSSNRGFGLVFAAVFAVLAALPPFGAAKWLYAAAAPALGFLALALAAPDALAPLNRLWTRFALLLNRITQPLMMGLLFFVAITPFAAIRRAVRRDPLKLRFDRAAASYWICRGQGEPPPEAMKDPF